MGQVGGSGKSSPSQSHEPRSKVATAVAAGGKKKALCVCVNGGEERRIGTGGGEEVGKRGRKGGRCEGEGGRAANTAVERS